MEDIKLYIQPDIKGDNHNFYIRVEGWKNTCVKDFCKLLGCYQKTFLKSMNQFNHYLYIYANWSERLDFFFHTEEDALAAKEWIEAQLVMKQFLQNCLQNTHNMI